jgi:hypothetical protein
VYYLLYTYGYEKPSKVAIDPEEPALGRVRVDSIPPPHTLDSIKQLISRVEGTSALAFADIFMDISCESPLTEGHISMHRGGGPGRSVNKPIAVVLGNYSSQPPIPEGTYVIKNRATDYFWNAGHNPIRTLYYCQSDERTVKAECYPQFQVNY